MTSSNVDSLLKSIASSNTRNGLDDSYTEVGDAMKHTGRPTNNMLLSVIHGETKRTADEVLSVNSRLTSLEETMVATLSELRRLCSLTETQNEILASNALASSSSRAKPSTENKNSVAGVRYYQATKLSSKYHAYACIISHLISMVEVHMDVMGIYYPDSVDCEFNTLQNAVRVVSGERCRIPNVEYKNDINLKEKDTQAFKQLFPIISSSSADDPVTLSESMLSRLSNQVTRGVMQDVEWIRQRLCHLDGILSAKQIDVLKSLKHPVLKPDSDSELNWNRKMVSPRQSHPGTKDVNDLLKTQKDRYIVLRMQNKGLLVAYEEAKEYTSNKKK